MTSGSAATGFETGSAGDDPPEPTGLGRWVAWATGFVSYVGGLALLAGAVLAAPLRRRRGQPRLLAETAQHFEALFVLGLPLLAVIHLGFGSVLAMQAFFRATFPETNGAVVGVGLIRSIAPLLTGIALSGFVAVRAALELTPTWDDQEDEDASRPDVGRAVLTRVLAAALAGPVLALWGAAVGTVGGALVSGRVLGVASGTYFGFLFEMLQGTDVLGMAVLGAAYPAAGALIACHEALRRPHRAMGVASFVCAYRAVALAAVAMLLINGVWFRCIYLSGGPNGLVLTTGAG